MELALPVGQTKQTAKVTLDVLPLAKQGCRAYFSLSSVYSVLGLAKANHASQWVHERLLGFMSGLAKAGLAGHLARPWSDHHKQHRKRGQSATKVEECDLLSSPSASSCGLFFLLMQWGYRSKIKGGFGDEGEQRAAQELPKSLVVIVASGMQRLDLALAGHDDWVPPRPMTGRSRVSLRIDLQRGIEFPALRADLADGKVSFLQSKLNWASGATSSLSAFVDSDCQACVVKEWSFLPVQLAVRFGCALDRALAPLGDWSLGGELPLALSWVDHAERSEAQLNYRDMRYWHLGRQAAADHIDQPWCIVTDGTRAGGREVVNGAVIFPSNVAVQFSQGTKPTPTLGQPAG